MKSGNKQGVWFQTQYVFVMCLFTPSFRRSQLAVQAQLLCMRTY